MKKLFFLFVVLLGLFIYWKESNTNDQTNSNFSNELSLTQDNYSPWDIPWLEDFHQLYSIKDATYYHLEKAPLIPIDKISIPFQQALLAMEDRRFYDHIGFDLEGIFRATLINLQEGEFTEGASTITQQFIKNTFLTQDQTIIRKIKELLFAIQLEQNFSKEEILSMYVSTIYFGSGAYGIQEASQTYFNKEPSLLTLAESAMLVGLIPAPSNYSPHVNFELAKERQVIVLDTMLKLNIITPRQAKEAKNEKLYIY